MALYLGLSSQMTLTYNAFWNKLLPAPPSPFWLYSMEAKSVELGVILIQVWTSLPLVESKLFNPFKLRVLISISVDEMGNV